MSIQSPTCRAAIITAGCLCAAGIHAADGQLEINQACAISTGCFPGDAPGFPVTIVQPGSYRLTGNLDLSAFDPGLSGIQVSAPAVTVDLGGFHIAGPNTCSGSGASISCSFSGGGISAGVLFHSASGGVVQNGIVRNMKNFGILGRSNGLRVQNITAIHNGWDGINAGSGALVANCVSIENNSDGIELNGGSTADRVTAIGNGNHGFKFDDNGSTISQSSASKNGGRGFFLQGLSKYGKGNLSTANEEPDRCGGGICTEYRRIYLTPDEYRSDSAATACTAPGFQMASVADLLTLAVFVYDPVLGFTLPDSGEGPPADVGGWVRTGLPSSSLFNCSVWTDVIGTGTSASFEPTYRNTGDYPILMFQRSCRFPDAVWCVETAK